MRTHGHREGSTTRWALLGEIVEGQWVVGSWGEIAWGEMPDIGEGVEGITATCVPMQQSCVFFSCTPKPKIQLKITKKEIGTKYCYLDYIMLISVSFVSHNSIKCSS